MFQSESVAEILITFGGLFIIGLIADLLGRHTPLPRVTLLILTGFLMGPAILDWLPTFTREWFPVLSEIALAMIGFMLGQNLTKTKIQTMGRPILGISLSVMLMTALLMFFGLWLMDVPVEVALILAGIAPATAPAPIFDVTKEFNAQGPVTDTLLGIVAIDDAWGMLMFSLLLMLATIWAGTGEATGNIVHGLWEVGGAVGLGIMLGLPMAYLTRYIYPGKSTQAEVLGLVLLCAGIAEWLNVSYILSAMVMGILVANLARQNPERPFEEIEALQWPLLILFFLLAGSALELDALWSAGLIGLGYIVFRVLGRISGSYLGAKWAGCQDSSYQSLGLAMLPHAGIPIGMALLAVQQVPEHKDTILAVILGGTIIFELIGPPLTRHILVNAKEINSPHVDR